MPDRLPMRMAAVLPTESFDLSRVGWNSWSIAIFTLHCTAHPFTLILGPTEQKQLRLGTRQLAQLVCPGCEGPNGKITYTYNHYNNYVE